MVQTMTVADAFAEALRRVELNPARVDLASQRYNTIKQQIEGALPGKVVRQVGSFQRRTKIRPQDPNGPLDVDATVSFGSFRHYAAPGTGGVTPGLALQLVRSALEGNKTYELMQPRVDAPTVSLRYADGFKIELIPAFEDATGQLVHPGGPTCYIVGNGEGGWTPADYDYDAGIIMGLNQVPAVRAKLVPAIKLIKTLLRNHNLGLNSFHVEILVALVVPALLANWSSQGFVAGFDVILAGFLLEAPGILTGSVSLPGSFSPPVDSGFSAWELQRRGEYLRRCGDQARAICLTHDESAAVSAWRNLFGEPFPT